MKKTIRIVSVAALLVATASVAQAQTVTGTGLAGAGNGPTAEITISGTVTSAVTLDIVGVTGVTTLSATNNTVNPPVGTIALGTFSALNPSSATNARVAARTTSGATGAILAASLDATLTYSGATTGTITIARKAAAGALPDIPAGNLRFALGDATTWAATPAGTNVPNPGSSVNACGGNAASATACRHELAVFIPDTQVSGAFSSVVVYTGTALP